MAEYIEREALLNKLEEVLERQTTLSGMYYMMGLIQAVKAAPAADVVEVRHGEWIITKKIIHSNNPYLGDDYYLRVECSECDLCVQETRGGYSYPTPITTNCCPNCGARMDGKGEGV